MSRSGAGTAAWTAADVGDQQGRTAVITGGNSGIGFEAARVLAARGATVVLACRDQAKAGQAASQIAAEVAVAAGATGGADAAGVAAGVGATGKADAAGVAAGVGATGGVAAAGAADGAGARVETVRLDLASLASVREAAEELRERYPRLDLLINNAGVMMPPYGRTEDGFELQIGTNHLGHFALTGLVLDRLLAVGGSRVVTVSSNGHRMGRINFDDLNFEHGYRRPRAYGQSKLANLMFTYELQRRLAASGAPTIALAAHPGSSRTELGRHLPGVGRLMTNADLGFISSRFIQDAQMGALPTLRAATDPGASGGQYYGPGRVFEFTGYPVAVESNDRSRDVNVQNRLWEESEKLTGVSFPV